MPDPARTRSDDFDFAGEMQALANQAQAKSSGAVRVDQNDLTLAFGKMLRPLASELETLKRGNTDLSGLLTSLIKTLSAQAAAHPPAPASAASPALDAISQQLTRLGSVESANQKLFDALHTELKGYKDGFLFDALQKPFIRDLVSLFDDFSAVHGQTSQRLALLKERHPEGTEETAFLHTLTGNVENQLHHMIEVFLRLDVAITKTAPGMPADKKVHRIVALEPAAGADEDGQVVRSAKPGFAWRERVIRPEEVVVRRWKPAASEPAAAKTSVLIPA